MELHCLVLCSCFIEFDKWKFVSTVERISTAGNGEWRLKYGFSLFEVFRRFIVIFTFIVSISAPLVYEKDYGTYIKTI